jgi:hypothetical protein
MGAMYIGQQFVQNVLDYSTIDAGAAILPAAVLMVLVEPRSAKPVEARGARFTLLFGYVFVFLGLLTMLLLWEESASYWRVGLAYGLVGIASAWPEHPPRARSPARFPSGERAWPQVPPICSATSAAPSCSRSSLRSLPPGTPRRPAAWSPPMSTATCNLS